MLKRSMIASAALHAGIIAAASFAWPHALDLSDDSPPVIPVDLVQLADQTNIAPTVEKPQPAPLPEEKTPPEPQPIQVASAEPPPPEAEELAPPELEPSPEPPKPQKKAEDQAPAPANPVVPRRRPAPQKQQKFDVDSVLALLDKRAPKAPAPAPANAPVAQETRKGIGAQNAFTMDLKDALLTQMRQCWNVPVGAPHPEKLIVQIRVFLAPDGSLAEPPQLEPATRSAVAADPYMRTAAEAALRAINVCEPYKHLPAERYDTWREIVMTFDPSKMVGR
jgi:hypothetical protein